MTPLLLFSHSPTDMILRSASGAALRVAPLALALLLSGCGSDAADAQPGDAPEAPASTEAAPAPSADPQPDAMPASAATLPDLTPEAVSSDSPIPARELSDAVFGLMGQTVAVQGISMGESPLGGAIRLAAIASPDPTTDPIVECAFPSMPSPVPEGPVTVQGTVAPPNLAGQTLLKMTECTVASGDAMSVADLAGRITGWIGKGVAIVGRYNGQVTSSLSGGPKTVVRVQDNGTDGLATQVAGCELAAGATVPEAASSERDGVIFEGTISDLQNWRSSEVSLTDCRITNR